MFNFLKKIINWFCGGFIIRCPKCWGTIIPSDPITLHKLEYDFTLKNTVILSGESVCCFRKKCRGGHKIDGYWVSPGIVEKNFYKW